MQGFKHDGTNRTPNTTWIYPIDENSEWLAANDPCTIELGNGWRLPNSNEWTNIDANGGWTNWTDAWNSDLKLHVAGRLTPGNGELEHRTGAAGFGYYWSSSQYNNTFAWYLWFNQYNCGLWHDVLKAEAHPVRCVKDL